jgi:hypothetical protein
MVDDRHDPRGSGKGTGNAPILLSLSFPAVNNELFKVFAYFPRITA